MKLLFLMYMLITVLTYGYDYPYKDPYLATVIATPLKYMPKMGHKKFKTVLFDINSSNIPPNLWYLKKFKVGLMAQKTKSPLLFLFAGTGSSYNSFKMIAFSRILFLHGFSVVMLPSSFNPDYIVSASKTHVPGNLQKDSKEMYNIMKIVLKKINPEIKYTDIFLAGYSLGGALSLSLGEIDSHEKYFNFKRILAVNPPVNLYESAVILDKMFDDNLENERELSSLMSQIISVGLRVSNKGPSFQIDESSIYNIFKEANLDNRQLKIVIGLVFRLMAIDINYITDLMTKSGVYTKPNIKTTKYQNMNKYFKVIQYSNLQDYIKKIAFKTLKKTNKSLTFNKMIANSSIKPISNYLRKAKNIQVVTNKDDFILNSNNLKFLKKTLNKKIKIYPYGGHCGNMFYKENMIFDINFLLRGERQ